MKRWGLIFFFVCFSLVAQDDITSSRQNAITRSVKKALPAVVGINVVQIQEFTYGNPFFNDDFFSQFFPKQKYYDKVKGLGSGFIISSDGYIVTNHHVINGAVEIVVTLTDGTKYPAKIVGGDKTTDIALLKIEPERKLKYLEFGDSEKLLIGEWVIAMGNPFGLFDINSQPTVTVGVISATNRDFGLVDNDHVYQNMIQTDAAINGGNSGGPLLNSNGEVIGMNTFIYSGSSTSKTSIGIGFAIPIHRIDKIISELKSNGKVDRYFTMGFRYQQVDQMIAKYLGLKELRGIVVSEIIKNGPAENAGLLVGDLIVKINDKPINSEYDFRKITLGDDLRAGDVVDVEVLREKKRLTFQLKLGKV
ncbi:MAG TPA: trypsin-like peptidase domain-containing protein [bacterium]|nr:trypsin-like peptidase domain-containing protein [bacterium]HMW35339.1 trypsin-like peptidase domain-containing protein [bacterium]HMY36924.1 trypsin-like peptidase domain-containing protein [bacterium]HMZ05552.1 trypsin-like peptidase domain-containing protein [bacterium]HNE84441.1 trypsin-like peptidase domain-containing protein [bacterium]